MTLVCWYGGGLSDDLTGVERFALSFADELLRREVLTPQELTVFADEGVRWGADFKRRGIRVVTAPRRRVLRPPRPPDGCALVHGLGASRLPRTPGQSGPATVFSVYDWGPFRDRRISAKARVNWCRSIVSGVRQAEVTHYLNTQLAEKRPPLVPMPQRSVVAYPSSSLATLPADWCLPEEAEPNYALFVGSAARRKRVGLIVQMAQQARVPVVLLGAGTERHAGFPFVTALGRVDDQKLAPLLDGASAVILVSEYEGFGIPVLEAAARGIWSVVSAEVAASLPPPLLDFTVIVNPEDWQDFAQGIKQASNMRGSARFNASALTDCLVQVYTSILSGR